MPTKQPILITNKPKVTRGTTHALPLYHIILKSEMADAHRKVYYFDKNLKFTYTIYHVKDKRPSFLQHGHTLTDRKGFVIKAIDYQEINTAMLKRAIYKLQIGDTPETLQEHYNKLLANKPTRKQQMASTEITTKEILQARRKRYERKIPETVTEKLIKNNNTEYKVAQFIQRVSPPKFDRAQDNKDTNTFDFIRVTIGVANTWYMDKRTFIQENRKEIFRIVLAKIKTSNRFQKYNVPINFLRLTECTLTHTSELELTFELKQIPEPKDTP